MIDKQTSSTAPAKGGKYLTFALGKEEYGIEILKVREIIGCTDITTLPNMAAHVSGVMNLRGQVLPVMHLRAKFSMPAAARTEQTCIIVVETAHAGRKRFVGVIVDRVSEVLWIGADHVQETPVFDASVQTDFIVGIARVGAAIKILLNIDRVIAINDIAAAGVQAAA